MTDVRAYVLEHLNQVFYQDLSLCGCGDPGAAFELVHQILKLIPLYQNDNWVRAEALIGSPGAVHIVLSALNDAELLEHGSVIRGSWIADKGRWVLQAIDHVGLEDLDEKLSDVGLPHQGNGCTSKCWTRVPR